MDKLPVLIIISFLLSSCFNKESQHQDKDFKMSINIKGKTLISEENLLDPNNIAIIDTFLIIGNYKGAPLIEIYGKSGNLIRKITNRGNGPNEILMLGAIQINEEQQSFFVNDLFRRRIYKYQLQKCLNDTTYNPKCIYPGASVIDNTDIMFDKLFRANDFFIGESRSPKGRVALINKNGNLIGYFGQYPPKEKLNIELSDQINAELYASGIAFNPKKTKMAMATYSAGLLDLFNIQNDSTIKKYWSSNLFYPNGVQMHKIGENYYPVYSDNSKKGYLDLFATDSYVYALYSGKYLHDETYKFGNLIRVVSWNSPKTFELHLNKSVKRITVDKNDNYIYGTAINERGAPEIVSFEIQKTLKATLTH